MTLTIFLVLLLSPLSSQSAKLVIESLISQLTLEFRNTHPDLAFQPNLAVLPVQNQSPSAEEYEVGPAFTAIIRSLLERSLLFNLVDEELRAEMIEEIKSFLSGLASGSLIRRSLTFFPLCSITESASGLWPGGGLALAPGAVRFDKSYNEKGINLDAEDVENMAADLPEGSTITYSKDRSPYFSLHLGAGYVWNFSKTLNLTAGAELSMAQTFLEQEYTIPLNDGQDSYGTYTVTSNDISLFSIAPTVKVQYFVTPRVAFQFTYQFKYQLNKDTESTNYFFRDGSYGDGAPIPELYELDPTVDPYGSYSRSLWREAYHRYVRPYCQYGGGVLFLGNSRPEGRAHQS